MESARSMSAYVKRERELPKSKDQALNERELKMTYPETAGAPGEEAEGEYYLLKTNFTNVMNCSRCIAVDVCFAPGWLFFSFITSMAACWQQHHPSCLSSGLSVRAPCLTG